MAGSSLVRAPRCAVAAPINAKPNNLPSADSKRASRPPSAGIVVHLPSAPFAGGETMVGKAGVFTITGIAG